MSDPKIFIFAEPDGTAESNQKMEKYGCGLSKGDADWHTPQGNNEEEMIGMASDAEALLGTSIRSSPITRDIMKANPNLRIVAKCTVGTDDIDVLPFVISSFSQRCAIIDPRSSDGFNTGSIEAANRYAGSDDQRMTTQLRSIRQSHEAIRVFYPDLCDFLCRQNFSPQSCRLGRGPAG